MEADVTKRELLQVSCLVCCYTAMKFETLLTARKPGRTFQDRLVRRENSGVPTGRGADVQVELDAVLQLKASPLGLLEDGLFLVIFVTKRKQVTK